MTQGNPTGSDIDIGAGDRDPPRPRPEPSTTRSSTRSSRPSPGGKCDIIISDPEHHGRPHQAGRHDPVLPGRPGLRRRQGQPGRHQDDDGPVRQEGRRRDRHDRGRLPPGHGRLQGPGPHAACTAGRQARDRHQAVRRRTPTRCSRSRPARSTPTSPTLRSPPITPTSSPTPFALSADPAARAGARRASASPRRSHRPLETAVQAALVAMINDGTYLTILKKYSDDAGAITADVANSQQDQVHSPDASPMTDPVRQTMERPGGIGSRGVVSAADAGGLLEPSSYHYDWSIFFDSIFQPDGQILSGLWLTVSISISARSIGVVLGRFAALGQDVASPAGSAGWPASTSGSSGARRCSSRSAFSSSASASRGSTRGRTSTCRARLIGRRRDPGRHLRPRPQRGGLHGRDRARRDPRRSTRARWRPRSRWA